MACIVRVTEENYTLFEDMIRWRMTGGQGEPCSEAPSEAICKELRNPDLAVYAASCEGVFVGWISLIYLPKVGRFGGHGHIYVDELWVEPSHRRRGLAAALLRKADEMAAARAATGLRLYVNQNNPGAQSLYEKSGYAVTGTAHFMEKDI